jgi:hypothetical protein
MTTDAAMIAVMTTDAAMIAVMTTDAAMIAAMTGGATAIGEAQTVRDARAQAAQATETATKEAVGKSNLPEVRRPRALHPPLDSAVAWVWIQMIGRHLFH